MICKELNKTFTNKTEMFKALKANKHMIIADKKANIYKSMDKGQSVLCKTINPNKFIETSKGLMTDNTKWYFVVNTTKILDSHKDLHKDGIWNKSSKDQQGKNYLVDTHNMSMLTTIADKSTIDIFVATIPFSAIGKDYTGNTQALIYAVRKTDIIMDKATEWLDKGYDIEGSVKMQYVNIELAMNSTSKDDVEEFKVYNDNINEVANKDDFESIEYFWAVSEAKNIGESSLVLRGSNGATGVLDNKNIQPSEDTDKTEPSDDTQKKVISKEQNDVINFYKNL